MHKQSRVVVRMSARCHHATLKVSSHTVVTEYLGAEDVARNVDG